jgi:hypothetical protein
MNKIPMQGDFKAARAWAEKAGISIDSPPFWLERYVTWLNSAGAAAEDFRKLTELAVAMVREERTASDPYEAMGRWQLKTYPISRRIEEKYPTYDSLVSPLEPGGKPFFFTLPLRKRLRAHDATACSAKGYFRKIVAAGLLSNIGRCKIESCRRFFHGKIGKLFCSDKCLRKAMRQTPKYKQRNAGDQRKHYDKYFRAKPPARGSRSKQARRRKPG